jgi:flagellar motor switch protein FliN/FliY
MSDETEITESETSSDATDDWASALAEQDAVESASDTADDAVTAAPLQKLEDEGRHNADEDINMDVILDIPVTIAMEIGRTTVNIRNLLQLNQGSVVELDRLAGEPMDVLVNGTLIAHGEVVVVNDKFGIRLTDVISATERLKKLK